MSRTGRPLALFGALALLVSAFLPWTEAGRTGIDLGLVSFGDELAQPTLGLVLVALAALPAVAALVDDHGWPRGVAAVLSGGLIVAWLAEGPDGAIATGTAWAMVAVGVLLIAAAVAAPSGRRAARYPEVDGAPRTATASEAPATPRTDTAPPAAPDGPDAAPDVPAAAPDDALARHGADAGPPAGGPRAAEEGARIVPFTATRQVEAWGPTRAACFTAAVLAVVDDVTGRDGLTGDGHVAVHITEDDDRAMLLSLAAQVVALLHAGRVPVAADLFDADDARLVGYLEVATVQTRHTISGPADAQVASEGRWWARLSFG